MVYVVIFVLWGLYRLLFRFPVYIEELLFKPLVFFPPVFSILTGEDRRGRLFGSFGFQKEGLALAIYYGLTLGVVYLLAVRLGNLVFSPGTFDLGFSLPPLRLLGTLGISLVTAFWEQLVFSGFILLRLRAAFADEWLSVGGTASLFMFLHLPILVTESGGSFLVVAIQLLLFFLVGFGNAVLMLRTRNILAPILSHTFWSMALTLF